MEESIFIRDFKKLKNEYEEFKILFDNTEKKIDLYRKDYEEKKNIYYQLLHDKNHDKNIIDQAKNNYIEKEKMFNESIKEYFNMFNNNMQINIKYKTEKEYYDEFIIFDSINDDEILFIHLKNTIMRFINKIHLIYNNDLLFNTVKLKKIYDINKNDENIKILIDENSRITNKILCINSFYEEFYK